MKSNYNKYKDNDPKDTIFRIHEILNRAGLFTVMDWLETGSDGAFSNRVTLYPSALGTNGKGTDRLYASASGYAELMERTQNVLLSKPVFRPRVAGHGAFAVFPDEKDVTADELLEQGDAFLSYMFEKLGCSDPFSKQDTILNYARMSENRNDGKIRAVPYADISEGKVVYLPDVLVHSVCGSNGMAAGNTLEEAIVQGMCEVYERYVNKMILTGKAVPPDIPEDELKKYSIWNLKKEIEGDGRYHVSVRDCSLGKGYPVAASIITDRHNGTFGIKLGSHPSMAVAVERTLTEALQGRSVDKISSANYFGSKDQAEAYHNIPNIMKVNIGFYPVTLLSSKPDWEYKPWTEWEGGSNKAFIARMLSMAERDGWHMFIRDNSHMGFPAVQIVVPGYTDMYTVDRTFLRSLRTVHNARDAFAHFPDTTLAEEKSILSLIRFKESSFIENTPAFIIGRPVTDIRMYSDRIGAFIAFKHRNYPVAEHFFTKLVTYYPDDDECTYFKALTDWCRAANLGLDDEGSFNLISELFGEELALRVRAEAEDPDGILKRNFPKLNCYDCENCELNGKGCDNMVEEEIQIKIKDAMKDSRVSQQELLDILSSLSEDFSEHCL
jgi:ribosomal protein S12 methylthiotransferase accessory factor